LALTAAPLAIVTLAAACTWSRATASSDLGQGWSQADRDYWYEQTQGSRLLPYRWAVALETAAGQGRFFDAGNMTRYGYLPAEATSKSGLPVGFAIDKQKDDGFRNSALRWYAGQDNQQEWVGMNCSACHTAELSIAGRPHRVDGGPTTADFQTMIEDLDNALRSTRDDPAKFERFAGIVLRETGRRANPARAAADRQTLRQALGQLIAWQERVAVANRGGSPDWPGPRYGHARLDAFGHIFNKVALFAGAENQSFNPSTAPVSYPFLWNTSQSDKVQWNGAVSNQPVRPVPGGQPFDYGALGRNAGEVTGVFGDIVLRPSPGLSGFRSSVQVQRLSELERLLARLRPPRWPAALGTIDTWPGSLADRGKQVFARERCQSCHTPLAPDDVTTKFNASMSLFRANVPGNVPPGTDPWMACNAFTYQIRTGVLRNTPEGLLSGRPLGEVEPTAKVLETVVKGELAGQKAELVKAATKAIFDSAPFPRPERPDTFIDPELERARRLQICMTAESPILAYKARPLTGIWATAPFLHNGSVPTLYDLLLPPEKRPQVFYLGTRRFDPKKVGFETAKAADNSFKFETHDSAGRAIPGNSNSGHDYRNARLSEDDRWALVEYLKTL
jgi:hypothetical protein